MLATLEDQGPASQAELSSRTGIYRSDLVAVISELAARGLVDRQPDPADRRRNMVTLTGQGRRQLSRLDELLADVEDAVLAPLTRRQREALTRLLATLVDHNGGQVGAAGASGSGVRRPSTQVVGPAAGGIGGRGQEIFRVALTRSYSWTMALA